MSAFFDKKEADLSGRKNRPARKGNGTPDRKATPSGDRKTKGTKDKVNGNGNHADANKTEATKVEEPETVETQDKQVVEDEGVVGETEVATET
jgi:hypothetical protein